MHYYFYNYKNLCIVQAKPVPGHNHRKPDIQQENTQNPIKMAKNTTYLTAMVGCSKDADSRFAVGPAAKCANILIRQ